MLGEDGNTYTLFLGCAAAVHSPGSAPGWTRDTYPGPSIVTIGASNAGIADATTLTAISKGTIQALYIVFDEGSSAGGVPLGPGYVHLDNIKVTINGTAHKWTSPADNGKQ